MSVAGKILYKNSRWKHLLSRLRSYFIWVPLIFVYTGILGTLSLVASLVDGSGRLQHWFAHLWSWLILKTTLAPVRVSGMDQVDTTKPHLYAVNHISAMDIPLLYVYLPFQFRIVAKHELFRYPFMGWHLRRSGQIDIDPSNAMSSLRSMNKAVQTLRGGMPIAVFPEGGRSYNGQVQPFLPGAFYTAIRAQVDIVPVALVGTYEMLPINTYHLMPRPLEVLFGKAIPTIGMTPRDMGRLAEMVKAAVEDLYYSRAAVPDPRKSDVAQSPPAMSPH
ncbi:MAG: 1-acyl-sn-glycerol-3-phosphate acyltransferase [Acidobacteriales bacterium]|nr:1-acyl-sn-glycerol-3-phosphate acyltransferase [Terriglobales bacterium]